jgi:hypothetical protein
MENKRAISCTANSIRNLQITLERCEAFKRPKTIKSTRLNLIKIPGNWKRKVTI